ncbi:MAG: hypothetical protein EPN53_17085 [Acidobacteria bacterium]|nr:MAG: hypothetical protein EPN53_17085 [Acidobacteriota bacterium]
MRSLGSRPAFDKPGEDRRRPGTEHRAPSAGHRAPGTEHRAKRQGSAPEGLASGDRRFGHPREGEDPRPRWSGTGTRSSSSPRRRGSRPCSPGAAPSLERICAVSPLAPARPPPGPSRTGLRASRLRAGRGRNEVCGWRP